MSSQTCQSYPSLSALTHKISRTQQEVCCSVLERMLGSLSSALILENLHHEFIRLLQQGSEPVQSLCLSQLLRVSAESPELLCQSTDLMVGITSQIASPNQQLACMATTILVNIGETPGGLGALYSGPIFETLQAVMAKDDTVRYRVYQLVVQISTISPEALEMSSQTGVLTKLINEMQTDDILLQLNCLELLSDLAQTSQGLTFLDQQGTVKRLEEMMATVGESPFGPYLLPGFLKFFGGLARFHPKEVLSHFQVFLNLLFDAINDKGDPSMKCLAIDTLGSISSTPEGKSALEKQGNTMTECLANLGKIIKNSPSDMRARALVTLANLLKIQVADQTEELLRITQNWFSRICANPFEVIWNIAKQPFSDLKVPAMLVLQSLALTPWGQQLMNNAAGFKEYLLDRAMENTKEGKEAKFHVVQAIAESPTTADIFGRPYYMQVTEFFRQGAFFVQAQSEVAYEES
ncbi:26S proteasome non-ATPase regulatory subunit 5-like isoform X2 [Littorina saxatilis]|uniref:26S proteasome non-ATPase regulatory subunit 5-like isoform X2 n=1 Tax=Littorina saxatilis TaxID=31220 RepID=UPI0038B437D8